MLSEAQIDDCPVVFAFLYVTDRQLGKLLPPEANARRTASSALADREQAQLTPHRFFADGTAVFHPGAKPGIPESAILPFVLGPSGHACRCCAGSGREKG